MHSRTIIRNPNVCRLARQPVRHASLFSGPSFFPARYGVSPLQSFNQEFAPLIRLMDETVPSFEHFFRGFPQTALRSFQPRFDVRELDNSYELRGEIPGVEAKDVEVEFKDPQTLVIRGKTERESTSGTPPQAETAAAASAAPAPEQTTDAAAETAADDAASVHSGSTSSYQQPTVEDEGVAGPATPATTDADAAHAEASTSAQVEKAADAPVQQQPQGHYWVSERSTGSFQRVFSFRSRIDHDGVKASLKNGVLEVLVPKAAEPAARKITVE